VELTFKVWYGSELNVNKFFGIGSEFYKFRATVRNRFRIKLRLPHLGNKHGEVHVVVL